MTAQTTTAKTTARRAELLANRIEEGAAGLAAFAEGLSDARELSEPLEFEDQVQVRRQQQAPELFELHEHDPLPLDGFLEPA